MEGVFVLVLTGKGDENAETAMVLVFPDIEDAKMVCKNVTEEGKYWKHAQIIDEMQVVSLHKSALDWCT